MAIEALQHAIRLRSSRLDWPVFDFIRPTARVKRLAKDLPLSEHRLDLEGAFPATHFKNALTS